MAGSQTSWKLFPPWPDWIQIHITVRLACIWWKFHKKELFYYRSKPTAFEWDTLTFWKLSFSFRRLDINTHVFIFCGGGGSRTNLRPFPHRLTNIWQSKNRSKMSNVKASLWGCQPQSNVNAFVWPQMTDFIHSWFPSEICCTHSNDQCQKDKENWNFNGQINVTQLKGDCTALFFFFNKQLSPLVRNPLTVHPCHYQRLWIINTLPLNLFCSKQYLIEAWPEFDSHKSMVGFLTETCQISQTPAAT